MFMRMPCHVERDDSWTFDAMGFKLNDDNTIEWDYSIGGRFTDEQRLQEHLKKQSEPTLKHLIDSELGEDVNICVLNKYGDYLCEGTAEDMRTDDFFNFVIQPAQKSHSEQETAITEEIEDEAAASVESWRFYFIDVIVLVVGGGFCLVMILRQRRKTREELK
jgi:hypothetical protein